MPYLRVIQDKVHSARFNMLADWYLFQESIKRKIPDPMLRFYKFEPSSATIGYGSWKTLNGTIPGFDCVRRPTGGGVVCHGDDLVYAFIFPYQILGRLTRARECYRFFHEVLADTLQEWNVRTSLLLDEPSAPGNFCFDAPVQFDLMLGKSKISGAGQKRSEGYLLQQGSIDLKKVLPIQAEEDFRSRMAEKLSIALGYPQRLEALNSAEMEKIGNLRPTFLC